MYHVAIVFKMSEGRKYFCLFRVVAQIEYEVEYS